MSSWNSAAGTEERLPGQTGTGPAGKVAAPEMSSLSLFYSAVRAVYIRLIMRIIPTL